MIKGLLGWIAVVLVAGVLGASGVAMARGDAGAGRDKSALCAGCHGEKGISVSPEVPNLAGQKEAYLFSALRAYQTGTRAHPLMSSIVEGLSEQDMEDLAAYYSSL